jgi:LPS export ABC transporter protein LptC
MSIPIYKILKSIVITSVVAMLFSCEDKLSDIQKMNMSSRDPVGIAENFNLIYTDSGKVTSNLISPKMLDYSNREFDFSRFPEGMTVYFFDKQGQKTTVIADKAVNYSDTQIIELIGNVQIIKHDGANLKTEQLFWDQKNEWLFTEKKFIFTDVDGSVVEGVGIDFNMDLTIINITKMSAESLVKEENEPL